MKYLTTRNKLLQFEINAHVAQTHRYLNIYLADKFNIFSFNILDNHNFHFCQEMKSQITNSIPVEKTPKLEIETQGKKK